MYAYIDPSCGRPAFLLADKPVPGVRFLSSQSFHLDLSPIEPMSICQCDSCGETMFGTAASIENVVNYLQWKQENSTLEP